ncbi:phage major capsid protein, P2 family [Marinomonas sp.]
MSNYALSETGRKQLESFSQRMHETVGADQGKQFAVAPAAVQKLFEKAVEDGMPFLGKINSNVAVTEKVGEKIGLFVSGLVAGRTDTSGSTERQARSLHSLEKFGYALKQTNADVALKYSIIDQWKHVAAGKFAELYASAIRMAIANDRLRIGWYGTSAADTTNPTDNPLGEDVNIGWFQKIRNEAATQIGDDEITIGEGGDFTNLDSLVRALKDSIDPVFRNDPRLRVLIGSNLVSLAENKFYTAGGEKPSEKRHLDGGRLLDTYGGLQAETPPFFPENAVMITFYSNLSIYRQEGTWRRTIIDNPKKDQIEDFNSFNEDYIVEDYRAIAAETNVVAFDPDAE